MKLFSLNILTDSQVAIKIKENTTNKKVTISAERKRAQLESLKYEVNNYRNQLIERDRLNTRLADENERIHREIIKLRDMEVLKESINKIREILFKG